MKNKADKKRKNNSLLWYSIFTFLTTVLTLIIKIYDRKQIIKAVSGDSVKLLEVKEKTIIEEKP